MQVVAEATLPAVPAVPDLVDGKRRLLAEGGVTHQAAVGLPDPTHPSFQWQLKGSWYGSQRKRQRRGCDSCWQSPFQKLRLDHRLVRFLLLLALLLLFLFILFELGLQMLARVVDKCVGLQGSAVEKTQVWSLANFYLYCLMGEKSVG